MASLVLLAPALPDIEPSPELLAFAEAEEKAITVGQIDDAVEINVKMWAQESAPEVRELVAAMQRVAFDLQLSERAEFDELEPPVSARLSTIGVPTTIAVGDRDVIDFPQVAERLERELPDATLHRHRRRGTPARARPAGRGGAARAAPPRARSYDVSVASTVISTLPFSAPEIGQPSPAAAAAASNAA